MAPYLFHFQWPKPHLLSSVSHEHKLTTKQKNLLHSLLHFEWRENMSMEKRLEMYDANSHSSLREHRKFTKFHICTKMKQNSCLKYLLCRGRTSCIKSKYKIMHSLHTVMVIITIMQFHLQLLTTMKSQPFNPKQSQEISSLVMREFGCSWNRQLLRSVIHIQVQLLFEAWTMLKFLRKNIKRNNKLFRKKQLIIQEWKYMHCNFLKWSNTPTGLPLSAKNCWPTKQLGDKFHGFLSNNEHSTISILKQIMSPLNISMETDDFSTTNNNYMYMHVYSFKSLGWQHTIQMTRQMTENKPWACWW